MDAQAHAFLNATALLPPFSAPRLARSPHVFKNVMSSFERWRIHEKARELGLLSRTVEDYSLPLIQHKTRVRYNDTTIDASNKAAAHASGFSWESCDHASIHVRAWLQPTLHVEVGLPSAFPAASEWSSDGSKLQNRLERGHHHGGFDTHADFEATLTSRYDMSKLEESNGVTHKGTALRKIVQEMKQHLLRGAPQRHCLCP